MISGPIRSQFPRLLVREIVQFPLCSLNSWTSLGGWNMEVRRLYGLYYVFRRQLGASCVSQLALHPVLREQTFLVSQTLSPQGPGLLIEGDSIFLFVPPIFL